MNREISIAFLITAYGTVDNVNRFLKQVLLYNKSYAFIHIDSKSSINKRDIINNDRVYVMDKSYSVEWGDYSQIESVLALMKFASAHGEFDYYSLHSESDMLIRPISELVSFLERDHAYAYTWCYPLPYKNWQYGGGLGRIALYWPPIFRKKYKWNSCFRYMRSLYGKLYTLKIIKGKKLPENIKFWGKCDWFTINKECIKDIICFSDNNEWFNDWFVNSLIGSEIYFTTIIHMKDASRKIYSNNNLRYIDFKHQDFRKPGSPKELDINDIEMLENSKRFFARKFEESHDKKVIEYFIKKTVPDKEL